MSEQFKEEYWSGALGVLKREERKAWWNRYGLWLCLGVVVLSVSAYVLWPKNGSAVAHAAITESEEIHLRQSGEETSEVLLESSPHNQHVADEELTSASSSDDQSSSNRIENSSVSTVEPPHENDAVVNDNVVAIQPASGAQQQGIESTTNNLIAGQATSFDAGLSQEQDVQGIISDVESPVNVDQQGVGGEKISLSSSTIADMQNLANLSLASPENSMRPLKARSAIHLPGIEPRLIEIRRKTRKYPLFDYKKDRLFVYAGNSFLTGYGSYKRELFFSPEVGVGYEEVLAEHWSINGSLSYFMINGVRHSADFTSTQLDFGYNSTVTTISTLKLHYGYVPLVLNYDLNRRTSFSLGAGLSYLINSRSLVTVTEVDNFSENEVNRSEEWGYVGGYRTLNGSLLAGYEFRVTPELTFALNYQYGLQEITHENIYGQTSEDRNSRLRVLLKLDLK